MSSGNFTCREEVVIEEHHRILERVENFLLLDTLKEFRHWAINGTFKTPRPLFQQLFTVHVIIDGKAIPVIFGLLLNKQGQTYMKFFESILDVEPNLGPETVLVDFEKASLNAVRICFGQVRTVGGFFI